MRRVERCPSGAAKERAFSRGRSFRRSAALKFGHFVSGKRRKEPGDCVTGASGWDRTWGFVAEEATRRAAERRHLRSPMREHWGSRSAEEHAQAAERRHKWSAEMSPLRGLDSSETRLIVPALARWATHDVAAPRLEAETPRVVTVRRTVGGSTRKATPHARPI
jgi:hypothetical protein